MARSAATTTRSFSAWKAVAAAGLGVVLLGAGGATFAEWSDAEQSATGTAIVSGALDLEAGTGSWTNIAGSTVTAAVNDGSYLIVPGDALTYRETLTIDARGELLWATVTHNLLDLTGDDELLAQLRPSTTMSLGGRAVDGSSASVVADDEKQDLDVSVTVAFDSTTTGLFAQGQNVELGGLDIRLEQTPVDPAA